MKKIYLAVFCSLFVSGAYAGSYIGMLVNSKSVNAGETLYCNGLIIVFASSYSTSPPASYETVNKQLNGAKSTICKITVTGLNQEGASLEVDGGMVNVDLDPEHRSVSFSQPAFYNPITDLCWRDVIDGSNILQPTVGSLSIGVNPYDPSENVIFYSDNTVNGK